MANWGRVMQCLVGAFLVLLILAWSGDFLRVGSRSWTTKKPHTMHRLRGTTGLGKTPVLTPSKVESGGALRGTTGLGKAPVLTPSKVESGAVARQMSLASVTLVVYESAGLHEIGPLDNLLLSARQAGFSSTDVVVLGRGSQHLWKKSKNGELPFGIKLKAIRAFLETLPPNKLVFIMDGRDTIVQMPPEEIVRRFKTLVTARGKDPHNSLLFSAESACCVGPMWRHPPGSLMNFSMPGPHTARMRHTGDPPSAGGRLRNPSVRQQWIDFFVGEARAANATTEQFPYLNAGQFIGSAQTVAKLLDLVRSDITEDDQHLFSEAMWHASKGRGELGFVLDHDQKVVSSAGWRGPKLCPFSPRPQHCTFRRESWLGGHQVVRDLITDHIPAVIHTQNKFWSCYNSLVSRLLGKEGFMHEVSRSQLTRGTATTFNGGYHMLNASLMSEFQEHCPTVDMEPQSIGNSLDVQRKQQHQQQEHQLQSLKMSPMRVYSEREVQAARRQHAEQSLWMEFWNMHAGMIYEFSSTWDEDVVNRSVAVAWELQGRPSYLQTELQRRPLHHLSAEERKRHQLCDAVSANTLAQERAREWMNVTDDVVGTASMLALHATVEKGVPKIFQDLEAANNQLGEHLKIIFEKHPEHQTEHGEREVVDKAKLDILARPDVVLVGSDSCGTDLLGDLLAQHPKIAVPTEMLTSTQGGGRQNSSNGSMVLEVSPSHFELPQVLAAHAPEVKLVAVVCDPAQRALRQFEEDERLAASQASCGNGSDPLQPLWHRKARHLRSLLAEDNIDSFEALAGAIAKMESEGNVAQLSRKCSSKSCYYQQYFLPGLYQKHMMGALREFPVEQLLVVDGTALAAGDPQPLVQKVLSFLGLDPQLLHQDMLPRLGRRAGGSLSSDVQQGLQTLQNLYKRPNELLACLIKQDFPLKWGAPPGFHRSLQTTCNRLEGEIPVDEVEDSGLRASAPNLHRTSRP